jgi:hypothetical protein
MEKKPEQKASIKALQVGAKDCFGNTVTHVLSAGDEWAIYEIEHPDISERLRVFIDAHTAARESELAGRYNKVAQKYIEAKGLLYRSANFGVMKSRVAHALSVVLTSDDIDGNKEFEVLVDAIKKEYQTASKNRIYYLLPAVLLSFLISTIALFILFSPYYGKTLWVIICVLFGSCLGGSLSIFSGMKKYKFEEYLQPSSYFMFGFERIFLSFIAGGVAYVLFQSDMINFNKTLLDQNKWNIVLVSIVAGFAETFIPSLIQNVSINLVPKK